MDDFLQQLQIFFEQNVHSTDSAAVQNKLEIFLRTEASKGQFLEFKFNPGNCENSEVVVKILKFLARKHGLSEYLLKTILSPLTNYPIPLFYSQGKSYNIKNTTDVALLSHNFKIAQILNYCVHKNPNFVEFNSIVEAIEATISYAYPNYHKANVNEPQLIGLGDSSNKFKITQGILSQFFQCIGIKLSHGTSESIFGADSLKLQPYLSLLDSNTRVKILKKIDAHNLTKLNLSSKDTLDVENDCQSNKLSVDGDICSLGDQVLTKNSSKGKRNKEGVQADAVKTQQVVMTSYKNNVSEKKEIQSVNLFNALNGNRGRAVEKNKETAVSPLTERIKGSDRSWFNSTWGDVDTLYLKAVNREVIKDDDVVWMAGKCEKGFSLMKLLAGIQTMTTIAEIFARICDYQDIPENILDSLVESFFSNELDNKYGIAREKLLAVFELHSQRYNGNISPKLESTLKGFKDKKDCTTKMKKSVWKIFAKNEKNLEDTFMSAMNQLLAFRKFKDGLENVKDVLEFVGMQVTFSGRCTDLQERLKFVEELLIIIHNKEGHYSTQLRAEVANIVEDFMSHDLTSILKLSAYSPWLEVLVATYKTLLVEGSLVDVNDEKNLEGNLMRCILRILDKSTMTTNADKNNSDTLSPPSREVLGLLVDLCTKDVDRKLEALIVLTLGNLVNRAVATEGDFLFIPGFNRLAYKLSRRDAVDDTATVYLQDECKIYTNSGGYTFLSTLVGQILLYSIQNLSKSKKATGEDSINDIFEFSTLNFLVDGLNAKSNKMSRILCAECLFEAVLLQSFSYSICMGVSTYVLDSVTDVQVYTSAVYCICLKNICCSESSSVVSVDDLNLLSKLYAHDQVVVLGEKNYSMYINQPIIEIFGKLATKLAFSEDIFQVLTLILTSEELDSKEILEIIEKQLCNCEITEVSFPNYCFNAVEEIFVSEPNLFVISALIVEAAVRKHEALYSDVIIEHAHKNLMSLSDEEFSREWGVSFKLLMSAHVRLHLPEHIFQDLDLVLTGLMLMTFLMSIDQSFKQLHEKSELSSVLKPNRGFFERDEMNKEMIGQTLKCILFYQSHGRKLLYFHFVIMEHLLQSSIFSGNILHDAIQCLIYAVENRQSLSPHLIQNCVRNFRFEESALDNNNRSILSLAFALVNNNQTLPEDFVENLITFFCEDVTLGLLLGEDEEKDQIFSIISTISQNCQSPLPKEELVLDTFCNLWNKSNDHKKGIMFVGAREALVKKFGSFWKKSISQRYRVEILNALSGICKNKSNNERDSDSNQETSENNNYIIVDDEMKNALVKVHLIFMEAVQDSNVQTLETGLRCLISLNWDGANYCTDEHLELILSIQYKSNISPKTKNDIQAFFVHNRNVLHDSLFFQLQLLESILDEPDETFLKKLQEILSTRSFHETSEEIESENSKFLTNAKIFKSPKCQRRLENILFRKQNQELNVVVQALKILNDYPKKEVLSPGIFEAVAFTMVNNAENHSSRTVQRVQKFCKKILFQIIEERIFVSETLVNYIRSSVEHSDMLLKIINTSGLPEELPNTFRSKLELEAFCDALRSYCSEKEYNKKPIVAETSEKLGDLMTSIKQLDLDAAETCLDQITLNCLLSLDLEMLQSFPKVSYLIAKSVATLNVSITGLNYETATRLIERAIIKQSPDAVQVILIQAYQKVITDGYKQELEEVLKAFVKIFNIYEQNLKKSSTEANIDKGILGQRRRYKKKVQNAILICILEAIKCENDSMIPLPFIPFETFKMVVRQLQNPLPNIRHLAYQIVQSTELPNLLFNQKEDIDNELKEIHIPDLNSMALQVFQQIYKEQEELVLQRNLNAPNFVEEFMQFLYSITYWDFESVSKVKDDRTQWHKVLVISDFISCFAQSEGEKLKLKMYLTKLYNTFQEQKAQDLIFSLAELSREAFASEAKHFSAANAVIWLNQIDYDVSINILRKLDSEELDPFQVYHLLQETALAKRFGVKYSFKIKQRILKVLTRQLSTALNENLLATSILIDIIESVDDVNSLEELVKVIKEDVAVVEKTILNFPRELVEKQMSLAELKNTFECEILLSILLEDTKWKVRINRTFMKLLAFGISFQHIKKLITLADERTKDTTDFKKIVEFVICQASQYKIDSYLFEQIISSLDEADTVWKPIDCIDSCTRIINDYAFDATKGGVKSNDKIISELMCANPQFSITPQLKTLVADINSCEEYSKILKNDVKQIIYWNPEKIRMWADAVLKLCKESTLSNDLSEADFVREALMVTKQAFLLTTNYHMTNVQILACYFALTKDIPSTKRTTKEVKGLLQQVATGSGKSAIIAVISVIKSLQNLTVDVYTSNSVLAERDLKEWTKFYNLFGITTDHNGDKTSSYICGEKACYKKNIVYGDCSQFQFDYLRHSYSDLGTLGERKCQFAIIDEVDTMFIDDSSKLARLSSTLPGMDLLHIFYHCIWDRLTFLNNHLFQFFDQTYYLEGQIEMKKSKSDTVSYSFADNQTHELKIISNLLAYILSGNDLEIARIFPIPNNDLEKFVTDHLNKHADEIMKGNKLPKHLKEFARVQIPKWVDSAITAVTFQENVHYIVDEGQIKPVDFKTTGVVQTNTNWNNGLHSFLQIKHGLRMTSETLATNFMSNLAMVQMYDTNIIGFTATLGSQASQDLLKYVYKVDLLILPETHINRNVRFPDFIANTEIEWLQEILNTTLEETSKRRGVLIICETIKDAEIISNAVSKFKNIKVKMYTKNQENQEIQIERVHQGDVIVATNLAGRGTDVKTIEIEKYGGLHVCLTFLPSSRRVDEQAFGRTSRQGKKGTGQLIITRNGGVLRNNSVSAETLLEQRENEERSALDDFKHNKLTVIQTKGELFHRFSKKLGEIRNFIKDKESGNFTKAADWTLRKLKFGRIIPSVTETITLQAVEERWAMFLRKVDDGRISNEIALKEYETFEAKLVRDQNEANFISQGQNCFYYIQLGNYEYGRHSKIYSTTKKAVHYFEEALKMDPEFAVGALVGMAYILLSGKENLKWFNSNDKNYKIVALEFLERALPLVHQEMTMLNVMQTFHSKNKHRFENKELAHQLTEKMNLLGSYLKTIEEAQTTVEKSLRRVHCTGIGTFTNTKQEYRVTRLIPNHTIESIDREIQWKDEPFQTFNLIFHNLSKYSDDSGRELDQAISTLSEPKLNKIKKMIYGKSFKVGLVCQNVDFGLILDSQSILEAGIVLHLELLNLEFDCDSALFNFDINVFSEFHSKSYSLEIGAELIKLRTMAMSDTVLAAQFKIEIHATLLNSSSREVHAEVLAKSRKVRENQLNDLIKKFNTDTDCSIQFLELKSPVEISDILRSIKAIDFMPSFVNVTLNALDIEKVADIKHSWENVLKNQVNRNSVSIANIESDNGAQNVIRALRELNVDFVLHCSGLSRETAQMLLKNASVDQEDIYQTEWKELIQLYMADRLPLVELRDLSYRGISLIVTFNGKRFVPWISVASLAALAIAQATIGGFLISTGFGATFGMSMFTEGMSDLIAAQRFYSTRQFSWADYRTQKAVSVVISLTSMGLSSITDGLKGASMINAVVSEIKEYIGTRIIINGAPLSETISFAGKNLRALAVKQVSVSVAETGARITLKSVTDGVADFRFAQLRKSIAQEVSIKVTTEFSREDFKNLLSYYYAMDLISRNQELTTKIMSIVEGTGNTKGSVWESVAMPLMNGILSSPKFLGTQYSIFTQACGTISGISQIATIIQQVFAEVLRKLQQQKPTIVIIIQRYCGCSTGKAEKIFNNMKFIEDDSLDFEVVSFPTDIIMPSIDLKSYFNNLSKAQKEFSLDSAGISELIKSVVDVITSHIIHVANTHLVSPMMSTAVGGVIAKMSTEIQDRFLVNKEENTEKQNEIMRKVDELKNKKINERTKEDIQFLKEYDDKNTFASQINYNDKDFTVAWQKREIAVRAYEKNQSNENVKNDKRMSKILCVLNQSEIGIADMLALAGKNEVDMKIVDDQNYKPTKEDTESDVKIVIFQKGTDDSIGHYMLMDAKSGQIVDVPSTDMNCGYAIMSKLTGKSIDELRVDVANYILVNPEYHEIQEISQWVIDRHPMEANTILMVGGAVDKNEQPRGESKREINKREKEEKLRLRKENGPPLNAKPTLDDGEGYNYLMVLNDSPEIQGSDNAVTLKIGMTDIENADVRPQRIASKNNEKCETEYYPSQYRKYGEQLIHKALLKFRINRPDVREGKTEFFQCEKNELEYVRSTMHKVNEIIPKITGEENMPPGMPKKTVVPQRRPRRQPRQPRE